MKSKRLSVNGHIVEVVSIKGFGDIVGKSRNTLLRYERSGVLPPAIIVCNGYRYYTISMAKKLQPLISSLPLNRKPDAELLAKISQVFKDERTMLCQE